MAAYFATFLGKSHTARGGGVRFGSALFRSMLMKKLTLDLSAASFTTRVGASGHAKLTTRANPRGTLVGPARAVARASKSTMCAALVS